MLPGGVGILMWLGRTWERAWSHSWDNVPGALSKQKKQGHVGIKAIKKKLPHVKQLAHCRLFLWSLVPSSVDYVGKETAKGLGNIQKPIISTYQNAKLI